MELTLRVMALAGLLWLVALCLIGILFGFVASALVVSFVVVACLLWRDVPARTRPESEARVICVGGYSRLIAA